MQTDTDKSRLRVEAAAARAAAHDERRDAAADGLARRFVDGLAAELGRATRVSLFWSMRDEIDVRPLMAVLRERGLEIALPVMQGADRPLIFRDWRPGEALVRGIFGVDEPADGADVRPDIVAVPLLAFDAAGNRLGYGGGYYDRTLRSLRADGPVLAVGVAYDEQEIARVPTHGGDEPLDVVVTDRRMIDCRGTTGTGRNGTREQG